MHNPYVARYYLADDADPAPNSQSVVLPDQVSVAADTTKEQQTSRGFAYFLIGLAVVFVLAAIGVSLVVSFLYSTAAVDQTHQYVVFTGSLTRDFTEPNVYPVTLESGTEYTRLYYCMMDSDIGKEKCGSKQPVVDYQQCIDSIHDCKPSSSRTWPRDGGFLECLQSNFQVNVSQTSRFLACEDSSEGVMLEVFRNMNSGVFLGSYNYVSLLATSVVISTSFVVATAGGIYHGDAIQIGKSGHITWTAPLSYWFIIVAWVWNFVGLCFSLGAMWTKDKFFNGDPVTLWTSLLTSGAYLLASTFYSNYLLEYIYDWYNDDKTGAPSDAKAEVVTVPDGSAPEGGANQVPKDVAYAYCNNPRHRALARQAYYQPRSAAWVGGRYIGVKFASTESASQDDWHKIAPLMVQTFAWDWVFTDGLLFVGMLHAQTSVLNSQAQRVFFSITSARLLQLAFAYFLNRSLLNTSTERTYGRLIKGTKPQEFGVQLMALLVYAASLFCLADALYQFSWSWKYLSEGIASSGPAGVSIAFTILVSVVPELFRIVFLIAVSIWDIDIHYMLSILEGIFAYEWIIRHIWVLTTLLVVVPILKNAQADYHSFNSLFLA